jgi:hypothetical protein
VVKAFAKPLNSFRFWEASTGTALNWKMHRLKFVDYGKEGIGSNGCFSSLVYFGISGKALNSWKWTERSSEDNSPRCKFDSIRPEGMQAM